MPRTSSSTEGRSRNLTEIECNPAAAATLASRETRGGDHCRRARLRGRCWPWPPWARATRTTGTGRCPGVELREAQLETPVRVVVGGKAYDVRPGEALRLDGAATEQALWDAGREQLHRQDAAARRPEPADAGRRPGARPAPEARGGRRASLRGAAEAAPRTGRRAQRLPRHPGPPGRRGRPGPAGRLAGQGVPDRRAHADAGADPRRARADDRRRGSRGRRGRRR